MKVLFAFLLFCPTCKSEREQLLDAQVRVVVPGEFETLDIPANTVALNYPRQEPQRPERVAHGPSEEAVKSLRAWLFQLMGIDNQP